MPFEFIDNNAALSPAARRRIRSHAATGKNAGKTIRRRSKKSALSGRIRTEFRIQDATRLQSDARPDSEVTKELAPKIEGQVGDALSTLFFPVHVPPENRPVVKRGISFFLGVRYVPEVRAAFDRGNRSPSMWIQLMFVDAAYFHIAMAVSIASINKLAPVAGDADREMYHLGHTLCLVNQRLSGTEATCDATLAAVAMMAQYERHQGRHAQGLLHLDGLYRLVNLRGGIRELLRENITLAQKIVRLDLEYAFETGSRTKFRMDDVVHSRASALQLRERLNVEYHHQIPHFLRFRELCPELLDIAVDMTTLSWIYSDAILGRRPRVPMLEGCMALWELGYRLLHFRPLPEPRPVTAAENTVHLGLLMFTVPFLHKLDGQIPDCPLLYERAHLAAERYVEVADNATDLVVLLWTLLVGASSAFSYPHDMRIVWIVGRLVRKLQLETWEDLTEVVAGFPWVDALFTKSGQSLFHAATAFLTGHQIDDSV